ncbi:CHAT domain-containing protein [Lewinella sp. JB7]|uniref:CHAT domain-containing protein n=1 Tax=Lewinella sp. JB7 TaxID=2962887 RepID=UPI0020C964FE|nr:CHAT domain-containing protein [Lewinella sp. JB7]MCP9234485.1 CHAT domain-containing protein [Lewinella sp. JB7]
MATAYRMLLVGLLASVLPLCLPAQETTEPVPAPNTREEMLVRGLAYLEAGEHAPARELLICVAFGEADTIWEDSLSGLALHKLGVVAFNEANDSLAAHWFREAITVRDRYYKGPHNDRAHSRGGLADPLLYLGKLDEALDVIREAVAIYGAVDRVDSLNWLRSLNTLSSVAVESRNYQLGLSASYRALTLLDEMPHLAPGDAFYTCYNASIVQLRLDKLPQAAANAQRALTYVARTGSNLAVNTASAYNQLAVVQRELGKEEESYTNLLRGMETLLVGDPDSHVLGYLYLNLAEYYGGRGDAKQGNLYDTRAKEVFAQYGMLREYAIVDKFPRALHAMGRSDRALTLVNEKLKYLGDMPGDSITQWAAAHPGDVVPMIDLLSARAEILADLGERSDAIRDYATALSLQDQLRAQVNDFESRSYLSKNLRPFFDRAVALHFDSYRETGDTMHLWEAFALSERARAYSLLANLRAHADPSEEERRLSQHVAELERASTDNRPQQRIALAQARIKLDRLRDNRQSSELYRFALDRKALTDHIRNNDCTLLEYYLGSSINLLFVLTPSGQLSVHPIADGDALNDRIARWRQSIEEGEYRRKSLRPPPTQLELDRQFLVQGLELTNQLIPLSVRQSLHLRPRLCIVPDGGLNYLPFAALPLRAQPLPLDYHVVDYLQRITEVHYAYSAGFMLQVGKRSPATYQEDLLAFAPTFRAETGLQPLANNAHEVSQIAGLLPAATIFYGREANRSNFMTSLGRARILHLSSHGSVHPGNSNLSFVAFSQLGDSLDRSEMLYFNDLRNLPLNNELTVLSACETSLGELAAGETTMSFASALASAGSRSTLTTLWEVDDRATKGLIVDFYRRLVAGEGRATALNRAQSDHRSSRDYAHPYYWSGVVLYGAPGPIELNDRGLGQWAFGGWGWLVAGIVPIVGLLLYYVLKYRYSGRRESPESLADSRFQ